MKQRGRKTALSVVQGSAISAIDRPEPPSELTNEQRIEWILVVNSLPADWFPDETQKVLAQYCRHAVAGRHVATLIDDLEGSDAIDVVHYDRLLKMQERESRMLVSLATKMRMTQQSTYHPEKGKPTQTIENPWEDE